jgi:hypothetical protein
MTNQQSTSVAQAQTERRSFSYDEQQGDAASRTESATTQSPGVTQNAPVASGQGGAIYDSGSFQTRSYEPGSSYRSGQGNPPRYLLPASDPRKYRVR